MLVDETKDLSLAPFVCPPAIVHYVIVICVSRDWLQTSYWGHCKLKLTINTNQVKCWFLKRGENRSTRRKTSRCRVENQQTQPRYDAESGNRTRATFWKASTLITAPSLLPNGLLCFLDGLQAIDTKTQMTMLHCIIAVA